MTKTSSWAFTGKKSAIKTVQMICSSAADQEALEECTDILETGLVIGEAVPNPGNKKGEAEPHSRRT